jgi:hypothetical protein
LLRHRIGYVFAFDDYNRMPLSFAVLHPDPRDETRQLRDHGNDLFAQLTLRLIYIADRDVHDDGVHAWLLPIEIASILAHNSLRYKVAPDARLDPLRVDRRTDETRWYRAR